MKCESANAEMDRVKLLFPDLKGDTIGHVIQFLAQVSKVGKNHW